MTKQDLERLQQGLPPFATEALEYLTVPNNWLTYMQDYCLQRVIAQGGCKVKILYGQPATGKTHYLQYLRIYAEKQGFYSLYLDLNQTEFRITDIAALYKSVAKRMDFAALSHSLLQKILLLLGYELSDLAEFSGSLYDFICEREGAKIYAARHDVRKSINHVVKDLEIGFSFRLWLMRYLEALANADDDGIALLQQWVMGERLDTIQKRECQLFERLTKQNARVWLYSLIEVIKFTGYQGVVLMFDHFEAILPHSLSPIAYTPAKRNDVYEMLRQLMDDMDFLKNFLLIIAGNTSIITDETHGLESYHALWMRIQQSYKQGQVINPYTDLIDADQILETIRQSGGFDDLTAKIDSLMQQSAYPWAEIHPTACAQVINYSSIVQKHALKYQMEAENE